MLLNEECFSRKPDVELRVFGFYGQRCDLSFVRIMTNVRHFSADCLMTADNVDCISELIELESLGIGVFELSNFSVLDRVTPHLKTLHLSATRSKKPDLSVLSRFRDLRELYIEGHTKNIDVIAELTSLEDVTLRSVSTPGVDYLSGLSRLWSLDIKLGGIRSFEGIKCLSGLKYLELWQVMGLSCLDFISSLTGLQNLYLQALPRVRTLPALDQLRSLRRVTVDNMKGLSNFGELEWAPALEEFILYSGRNQYPEQLVPVLRNPSLKKALAGFGSDRKNPRFRQLLDDYERQEVDWRPFEYS